MVIFINKSYDYINVFQLDKEGFFSYIQKRVAAFRSGIIDLSNTKIKNEQHINFKKNIIISDDDNYHFSDDGNKITIIVDITLYNRLKQIEIKLFPMGD